MGGLDKGLVEFEGRPLVSHVAERLRPQVDCLRVSANRNLEQYRTLGFEAITDSLTDLRRTAGPLAGVLAGLECCETDWLVSVPCDSPALPGDLVERLLAAAQVAGAPAARAATAAGPHPVFMLVRCDLLPDLRRFLAEGRRRVREWQHGVGAATAHFADETAFANLNAADDLVRLAQSATPARREHRHDQQP